MSGTKPNNDRNKMGNSTSKGWSPPSGKQNPPAAGSHTPVGKVHKIVGDEGGNQSAGIHPSLKKPSLMR